LNLTEWPVLAWCVDQAVGTYGRWIEAMLSQREEIKGANGKVKGTRAKYRLDVLLGIERKPKPPSRRELIAALGGG
jgi:hypothetical protein